MPFRVPAPALVILLACLTIGWRLTGATRAEWAGLALGLDAASIVFAFRRRPSPSS